jgi:hypothetical protein
MEPAVNAFGRRGKHPDRSDSVLRALRHRSERGQMSVDEMVDVARVQLMRPGAPLNSASSEVRRRFETALATLAAAVPAHAPPTPRVLYAFAKAAAEAAETLVPDPRHPGVRVAERAAAGTTRALAEAAVFAEAIKSRDSEDLVRRAVTRAVRERKRKGGMVKVDVGEGDPLRALLDLPRTGAVVLPKNDLRAKLGETSEKTSFGGLLRKAARFSEELVRPALGEELWELGRPVGFADAGETRVLVETTSSVRAQELQLRGTELVTLLRLVPGMGRVQHIQLLVRPPTSLPVRSRRLPRADGR